MKNKKLKTKKIIIASLIVALVAGTAIFTQTDLLQGLTKLKKTGDITRSFEKKVEEVEEAAEEIEEVEEAAEEVEEVEEDNHCQPGKTEYTNIGTVISEESILEYEEFYTKIREEIERNNEGLDCPRQIHFIDGIGNFNATNNNMKIRCYIDEHSLVIIEDRDIDCLNYLEDFYFRTRLWHPNNAQNENGPLLDIPFRITTSFIYEHGLGTREIEGSSGYIVTYSE